MDNQPAGAETARRITDNIQKVIRGQAGAVRKLMAGLVTGGHVLLEDTPGTGKTTLAKALARSIDADFNRVQFTPDLLPSDILGVSIYDQSDGQFHFHRGPVFTHILLADEINRASPRTQSALLESMAEHQVSIDGRRYPLESLFFVIATQNPIESAGTYPLPEAQMDRFDMMFSLGYVAVEDELAILEDQRDQHPIHSLEAVVGLDLVTALSAHVRAVHIGEAVKRYIVDLVRATRSAEGVAVGASPRASLALMRISRALAAFDGLDYVTPDHVREIAVEVIAHRLVIDPQARFAGTSPAVVVDELLKSLPVPS